MDTLKHWINKKSIVKQDFNKLEIKYIFRKVSTFNSSIELINTDISPLEQNLLISPEFGCTGKEDDEIMHSDNWKQQPF